MSAQWQAEFDTRQNFENQKIRSITYLEKS